MKIIKSWRKSISLNLDENGDLIIKAPYFTSKNTIDTFIEKNLDWIDKTKKIILEQNKFFGEGEEFLFLGINYKLVFDNESEKIRFDGINFYLNFKHKDNIKEKFIDFYKKEAVLYIKNRVIEIANICDLKYNSLKITSAKTRWGSCSSKKNINFSFRLVLASKGAIDYVIIHELSHLLEMNHSKNFWLFVYDFSNRINLGDYKPHQKWLKTNGSKLMYV